MTPIQSINPNTDNSVWAGAQLRPATDAGIGIDQDPTSQPNTVEQTVDGKPLVIVPLHQDANVTVQREVTLDRSGQSSPTINWSLSAVTVPIRSGSPRTIAAR